MPISIVNIVLFIRLYYIHIGQFILIISYTVSKCYSMLLLTLLDKSPISIISCKIVSMQPSHQWMVLLPELILVEESFISHVWMNIIEHTILLKVHILRMINVLSLGFGAFGWRIKVIL